MKLTRTSIKIIGVVISVLLIAGIAFGAYQIVKNVPALNKLANLFAPGPLKGPISSSRAANLDDDVIIDWTNYYRSQENTAALSKNDLLTKVATARAKDLFAKQYFEHTSPTGETAADVALEVGYNYKIIGENLALGDFKNEKDLVDAWMASPGHRENILKTDYEEIGVASILDEYEGRITWISVQIFGTKSPNCTFPNQNLKNEIDGNNETLNSWNSQISSLYDQGNSLISQGNAKIEQGNEIYTQTHDASLAQPYWDAGESLQNQGKAKISQADSLKTKLNSLKSQTDALIEQYNSQINDYNKCIS